MTNPFDFRTIVFAKHAQHVVLVHFPIALFTMGVACDLVALRSHNPRAAVVARYNLIVAALSVPLVWLTGLLAWRLVLGAPPFKGILLMHLIAGVLAGSVVVAAGWLHLRHPRSATAWRLSLELVGLLLVGLTAHLGGFLSGVNQPG